MKTKNLFLAGAMIFASFCTVSAQEMNWGVKAGANYSTLSGNEAETDYRLDFHAGLVTAFEISPKFSLQPELLYSMEGTESSFSFEEEGMTFSSEQKIKLGYLNLPIMAKFFVTDGLSLQAGPQVGYLLSAKNEYEFSSSFADEFDMDESGTEDVKDQLKKISFGVNFGLGYEFGSNLFLQARYHLGLSNIDDTEVDPDDDFEVEMGKIKNSGFQVSVGYKF